MSKKRIVYYDLLNICACFCVICMHHNGLAHIYSASAGWYQALLVEVCAYWAVPVFFMLTGATLFNYREKYSTAVFLKKRFLHTVIPFLIWSGLSLLFRQLTEPQGFPFRGVRAFLSDILCYKAENVYWFFIPLFSVYLCLPLLSYLKDKKRVLWYAVGVSFLLQSVLPYISDFIGVNYSRQLNIPVAASYLMYTILGYLLSVTDIDKPKRLLLYALGAGSAVFRYTATVILSRAAGKIDKTYFSYTGFFAVFLSVAVFVFFKYVFDGRLEKHAKGIAMISSCSFGIYLIHMLLIRTATLCGISMDGWQGRILGPFVIYGIAFLLVWGLKQIPLVKKIVP